MTQILVSLFGIATFFMGLIGNEKALFMLALLIPFERLFVQFNLPGINILTLILLPLCFSYLLKGDRTYIVPQVKWKLSTPILLLMFSTILAAFHPLVTQSTYSYSITAKIIELKRWFTYFILFFIYFQGSSNMKVVEKVMLFIAVGYCFESLHVFKDLLVQGRPRLYGSLGNPNELGAYLASFWVVVWAAIRLMGDRRWISILLKGALVLGIIGTIRTLSRGSYLALFATGLVFIFFKSKRVFMIALLSLALLVVFYQTLLPQFIVYRIQETFEKNDEIYGNGKFVLQKDSAGARILFWKAGLLMFRDNPILGVGFHQFRSWLPHYGASFGLTKPRPPHNMYVKMIAEQGIIGFSIFLWLFWRAFLAGLLLKKSIDFTHQTLGTTYCVTIAGLSVSMLFGDRFFFGALVGTFFILSGIVWSSIQKIDNLNHTQST